MTQTAERLWRILTATPPRLVDISDADASRPTTKGHWSKKEILGHLIDSAANNHQRFVRAQLAPNLEFPEYEQDGWVMAQAYGTESWPDLVNLWLLYNRHLLHVIRQIPEAALSVHCLIGDKPPVPLREVVSGYMEHLEHHLAQILG
jgi:hypothetical protein